MLSYWSLKSIFINLENQWKEEISKVIFLSGLEKVKKDNFKKLKNGKKRSRKKYALL
jgi:hypothetical protein